MIRVVFYLELTTIFENADNNNDLVNLHLSVTSFFFTLLMVFTLMISLFPFVFAVSALTGKIKFKAQSYKTFSSLVKRLILMGIDIYVEWLNLS